jgi:hypothetical protein
VTTLATADTRSGGAADAEVTQGAEDLVEWIQRRRVGLSGATAAVSDAIDVVEAVLADDPQPVAEGLIPIPALAPLEDQAPALASTLRQWLAATGVSEQAFRQDRLGFLVDGGTTTTWTPRAVLTNARRAFIEQGLIDPHHHLSVIWTSERPSMVFPIRIPGSTAMALPSRPCVLQFSYIHHELGHVIELDGRPSTWSLPQRWQRDPRVAEAWGLLFEALSREPDWLRHIGVAAAEASLIARHGYWEDRYNRCLAALVVVAARLPAPQRAEFIGRCDGGLLRDGHVVGECERASYWRALVAGYHWSDETLASLVVEYGPQWWGSPEAWDRLRGLRALTFEDGLASRSPSVVTAGL